ncbi:MAG: hypothetical protein V3T12_08670, partial [Acidiferrobacterales bacterium]
LPSPKNAASAAYGAGARRRIAAPTCVMTPTVARGPAAAQKISGTRAANSKHSGTRIEPIARPAHWLERSRRAQVLSSLPRTRVPPVFIAVPYPSGALALARVCAQLPFVGFHISYWRCVI